jgi:hypothetical protein
MVELLWDPTGTWQQGFIDAGTRLVDKKKQNFTFGTLFCGLEFLGAAWESGIYFSSIDRMSQRNKNRPRPQSSNHRMGEAPWGCIR